jgi:hypothetical protein
MRTSNGRSSIGSCGNYDRHDRRAAHPGSGRRHWRLHAVACFSTLRRAAAPRHFRPLESARRSREPRPAFHQQGRVEFRRHPAAAPVLGDTTRRGPLHRWHASRRAGVHRRDRRRRVFASHRRTQLPDPGDRTRQGARATRGRTSGTYLRAAAVRRRDRYLQTLADHRQHVHLHARRGRAQRHRHAAMDAPFHR